jgi:hypothetical protein
VYTSIAGWYEGERIRDGERGWFPAIILKCLYKLTQPIFEKLKMENNFSIQTSVKIYGY